MAPRELVPLPGNYHAEYHGTKAGEFWYHKARICPHCNEPMARDGHDIYRCQTCGVVDLYEPVYCPQCSAPMAFDEREVHHCKRCGIVDLFRPRMSQRSRIRQYQRLKSLKGFGRMKAQMWTESGCKCR